jgi:hypothetical protein
MLMGEVGPLVQRATVMVDASTDDNDMTTKWQ